MNYLKLLEPKPTITLSPSTQSSYLPSPEGLTINVAVQLAVLNLVGNVGEVGKNGWINYQKLNKLLI
jgi:hypothetical protein